MKNTKQFYFQNGLSVVLQGLSAMLKEADGEIISLISNGDFVLKNNLAGLSLDNYIKEIPLNPSYYGTNKILYTSPHNTSSQDAFINVVNLTKNEESSCLELVYPSRVNYVSSIAYIPLNVFNVKSVTIKARKTNGTLSIYHDGSIQLLYYDTESKDLINRKNFLINQTEDFIEYTADFDNPVTINYIMCQRDDCKMDIKDITFII